VAEGFWDVQTASLAGAGEGSVAALLAFLPSRGPASLAGAGEGSVAALLAFLPSVAQNGVLDEDEGFGNGKVKF